MCLVELVENGQLNKKTAQEIYNKCLIEYKK